jgi:hypothetical protein
LASLASSDREVSRGEIAALPGAPGVGAGQDSCYLKDEAVTIELLKTACAIIPSVYLRVIICHFDFTYQSVTQ